MMVTLEKIKRFKMKLTFLATMFLFSVTASAADSFLPDICYSSGECQERHSISFENRCLKVKTGLDASGNETCAMKCDKIPVGYTCLMIPEKVWGVCKKETIANMGNSNWCVDALDPSDI